MSSVGRLGKATNWHDDTEGQRVLDERQSMWGEMPGEIVSFDAQKQTATIKPLYKPRMNGKVMDMPELYEVPVRFARAGKGALTYPVAAGDKVTLRPLMRSTEKLHEEENFEASDARTFHLADMEAHLDGGESLKDPIQNFDAQNTHMRFNEEGTFGIRGSQDGKIKIEGSQGNIYDLLATVVELLATDTLVIQYGSSAGSGHQLEHKAQYLEIAQKLRAMALP